MFTNCNNRTSRKDIFCCLCGLFMVAVVLFLPLGGHCQGLGAPQGKELYNEMTGMSIWISPSRTIANAMHITLPTGIELEAVVGGISFNGTTPSKTSNQGNSSYGNVFSSDGRSIQLRPDGTFELSIGSMSTNCWTGAGTYSATIPADMGNGWYGVYRDQRTGGTLIYFFYKDGRWGFGSIDGQGNMITDKGLFR